MALVNLPGVPGPAAVNWQLVDFGNTQRGVLGGAVQRINRLGSRWRVEVTMPPLELFSAREWSAALTLGLQNGVSWLIPQPGLTNAVTGTVRVNGVDQAGYTLECDGAGAFQQAQAGQWISVNTAGRRYLYQLSENALSKAGGGITLKLSTPLRVAHADNDIIDFAFPFLDGFLSDVPSWAYDVDRVGRGFSFAIEEAR